MGGDGGTDRFSFKTKMSYSPPLYSSSNAPGVVGKSVEAVSPDIMILPFESNAIFLPTSASLPPI